ETLAAREPIALHAHELELYDLGVEERENPAHGADEESSAIPPPHHLREAHSRERGGDAGGEDLPRAPAPDALRRGDHVPFRRRDHPEIADLDALRLGETERRSRRLPGRIERCAPGRARHRLLSILLARLEARDRYDEPAR